MTCLTKYLPPTAVRHLSADERTYLTEAFTRFDGYPSLAQVWQLMDEQWLSCDCDPMDVDERVTAFYQHPVWILNGLFIEQHKQSLENRRVFADWVVRQEPARVADFGGGFGTLARMIGDICLDAVVEVIEPHPHRLAVAQAATTGNVRYQSKMGENYDIVIATDVFEHVPDPLALVAETAAALRPGGRYLIANCFEPVILCHLPQTFHFRHSWDWALEAMGLRAAEKVAYGRVFVRQGALDLDAARRIERRSRQLWPMTKQLPGRISRPLMRALS